MGLAPSPGGGLGPDVRIRVSRCRGLCHRKQEPQLSTLPKPLL